MTVYEKEHDAAQGEAIISLKSTGTKTFEIYYDGVLADTIDITFE